MGYHSLTGYYSLTGYNVLRYLFLSAAAGLLWLSVPLGLHAQTLLDTGAAITAGEELESRNARAAARAAPKDERAPAQAEPAEDADPEGDGEAGSAEGAARAPRAQPAAGDTSGLARSRKPGQEDKWGDSHAMYRDARPFLSWPKLLGVLIVFWWWTGVCNWVNRAAQVYKLGYAKWNAITVFTGLVGLMTVMNLPYFAASMPIYFLSVLVPMIVFSVVLNKSVEQHQKVFTKEWWRYEFATVANKFGMKMDAEIKADYEKGAPVDLFALGGDERENQANLMTARQSPGYLLVKDLIAEMSRLRSERVMLDYGQNAVAMRHMIDGVWTEAEQSDRESGDVMLAVMKQLANLNVKERTAKQSGEFAARFEGLEYRCPVVSQGVKTGERVMVRLVSPKLQSLKTYKDLGMRDKIAEEWSQALIAPEGVLVISAMPEGGMTTLTDVSLLETDRLMRDLFSIEDKQAPERDIENVAPHFYDSAKGQTPADIIPRLIRLYPDVYICRDFVNSESAKLLLNEAREDKLVITNIRAKEAAESLLRVLQKGAPHKEFVKTVHAAINSRLVRLLCAECKVAYEPSPDLLKKLGIPAGKVQQLYRAPTAEEANKPCRKCGATGYHGRTGLFEVLIVDDRVRETLLKQPKLEPLRKAARGAGMRTLQEEGVLLVAKGATSLQELQRILKQ